jgi:HEAT repeat protein
MKARFYFIPALTACFSLWPMFGHASAASYDLDATKGIEAFGGSSGAREILAKNGFVVADPAFKQIFEPYIKSPQVKEPSKKKPIGESLPSFITTDSAWHTYHVLLEEGVKEMEQIQSQRLLYFSRRLWAVSKELNNNSGAKDLGLFASVGLALQDEQHRKSLATEAKRIVDGLRAGMIPVDVPIGFSLAPQQFRAQSFYVQSPQLSDYFAARQWYASVVFRLTSPSETKTAIALATLVDGDAELLKLWKQLSEPFDSFLASAEDGTILQYVEAAKSVVGPKLPEGGLNDSQLTEVQNTLQGQLALPRVNDQLLTPEKYAEFSKQTRGLRLLPPRRLPCSVCFQNTVDPKIPKRRYPSGLDFLAASPVLRSPAAVRAVESQFGKSVSAMILKADCGPTPNSLHGEAMQLLAGLQKPLPPQAPACMRNEVWSDLQLWTQLGAWAEQRHTWALHTKISVSYMGMISPPKGMVAPYPEFFSGLAQLSRRTASAFQTANLDQKFEVKTAANRLLELLNLSQELSSARDEKELEMNSGKLEQLGRFQNRYYEKHKAELEKEGARDAWRRLGSQLKDLAQRCAASGEADEADTATLRLFFDCRQDIARLLGEFASVCDRLVELARKQLTGQGLSEDDARWIENYGVTLATFHFYYGNSYEVPIDNFPIVTRVFSNPLTDSMLYAGLARPQALYVIASDGKTSQLYRGAVMTYREFVRPNEQLLDDDSWRELVSKGQTPPAPPFTRSFCAETSAAELIAKLKVQETREDFNYGDIDETMWQIRSRATTNDLPALLNLLVTSTNSADSVTPEIAEIIARLQWQPYQATLVNLLAAPDSILADSAAQILIQRPTSLDVKKLISVFQSQTPRARRFYCVLLGSVAHESEAAGNLLLGATHDVDDGVRWQAVLAIGSTNWNDGRAVTALLGCLEDANQFVAAAAAHSLARCGATNAAPKLLGELGKRFQSKGPSDDEARLQIKAITTDMERSSRPVGGYSGGLQTVLDPDNLSLRLSIRAPERTKQMAARRLPPQPFDLPFHEFTLVDALIEALADLDFTPAVDEFFKLWGTDYDASSTRALSRIAPKRLSAELLAKARDKQLDGYLREQAMVTLCKLSLTNCVRELVPLLDDISPIVYERTLPGPEWRICDRAAASIALMLGWEAPIRLRYLSPERREELMKRAREWAKSGP